MGYNIFVHLATAEKSVRPKVWGRSPLQRRAGNQGAKRKRVGENSAMSERNQKVDSPAVLLEEAGRHRKILFSLGEKEIRRAPCLPAGRQNEKSKEYFSVVWRACRAVAGLASLVGVLLKECSNFVQKTPFFADSKRRVRDSNSRWVAPRMLSKHVH